MSKRIPRYRENKPLPPGYYDAPDPYETPPKSDINLRMMVVYANEAGKDPKELSIEEVAPFLNR